VTCPAVGKTVESGAGSFEISECGVTQTLDAQRLRSGVALRAAVRVFAAIRMTPITATTLSRRAVLRRVGFSICVHCGLLVEDF
jgi:hypothetical protein